MWFKEKKRTNNFTLIGMKCEFHTRFPIGLSVSLLILPFFRLEPQKSVSFFFLFKGEPYNKQFVKIEGIKAAPQQQ